MARLEAKNPRDPGGQFDNFGQDDILTMYFNCAFIWFFMSFVQMNL